MRSHVPPFYLLFSFCFWTTKLPLIQKKRGVGTVGRGGARVTPMAPGHLSTLLNVMFPLTGTEKNSDLMIPEMIHANNPGRSGVKGTGKRDKG